jgi:thiamine-monophosphate kinase
MRERNPAHSDEPERLANIVSDIFSGQSSDSSLSVHLTENTFAALTAGADAQDDCAVFRFAGDQELVVGSDYVRGSKFRLYELGLLDDYDVGYYLVAANVSDVAAMGARPIGVVTVVRYPPDMSDDTFADVLRGIRDACARFEAPNVGGDIGGAERLILSATAFGVCLPGHTLYRHGARPGDVLCMTGPTGIAGAAMSYFRSDTTSDVIENRYRERLLSSWTRPSARVREGVCLGDSSMVTSCQDTSDGLKATVESIAAASGVGVTIDEPLLPVAPEVSAVCEFLDIAPLPCVFGDSVDFELVFSVPRDKVTPLAELFAAQHLGFHTVGEVTAGDDVVLRRADGRRVPLPGVAWRHQSEVRPAEPAGH